MPDGLQTPGLLFYSCAFVCGKDFLKIDIIYIFSRPCLHQGTSIKSARNGYFPSWHVVEMNINQRHFPNLFNYVEDSSRSFSFSVEISQVNSKFDLTETRGGSDPSNARRTNQ